MMQSLKTLVFGASTNPSRYSFLAVNRLLQSGHEVVAIGGREGEIYGVSIVKGHPEFKDVHTITLYMGPDRLEEHMDYLIGLQPKRMIFNPGTEDAHLINRVKEAGILVEVACTLVMLSTGSYSVLSNVEQNS